jgi:competence protein ComEC
VPGSETGPGGLDPRDVGLAAWVGGVAAGFALLPSPSAVGPGSAGPPLVRWITAGPWLSPGLLSPTASLNGGVAWLVVAAIAALAVGGAARLFMGEAGGLRLALAGSACLALLLGGAAWGLAHRHAPGPGTVDGYLGRTVRLAGSVTSTSPGAGGGQRLRLEVRSLTLQGRRLAVAGGVLVDTTVPTLVEPGDEVVAGGRLAAPRRIGPGGQDGYDEHLQRQGVYAVMAAASVQPLAPAGPSVLLALARLRQAVLAQVSARFPEPEASVLGGLLLGARGHPPARVAADLQDSGLIHLLAISGLKVAIVAGVLESLLARLGARRGSVLGIAGVAIYVGIAGGGASALRSALMASLSMIGRALGRDTDPSRSLLLAAATMLAVSPGLCVDLGFQFSFLGVLGIHLVAAPAAAALPRCLPGVLREAVAVTLAAQALTLPLTARYFQVVPLLAPLANGIAVPLAPLTMLAGLVATAAGWVSDLGGALGAGFATLAAIAGALALVLLRGLLLLARAVAAMPGAIHLAAFGPVPTTSYYAGVAMALLGHRRRWRSATWLPLAGAVSLACLLLGSRPDGRLHVSFLAGVSGPAAVVRAPDGATLLVDGGSGAAALAPALDAALPSGWPPPGLGRRLDAAFLTGSSAAEAGAAGTLGRFGLALMLIPAVDDGGAALTAADAARRRGAEVVRLGVGEGTVWHGLLLRLVGAGPADLLEITWHEQRFLIGAGGTARDPAQPPPGSYVAVGLGARAPDPQLAPAAAWLAIQDGAARTGGRPPVYLQVGRVWRTSADGALDLACDPGGCAAPGP